MIDALPLRPAPGHAMLLPNADGGFTPRVLFTPPEVVSAETLRPTGDAWRAEPLGDGRAILRDASGASWGVFASEAMCRQTAERLSR